jgi:hypothetical protein
MQNSLFGTARCSIAVSFGDVPTWAAIATLALNFLPRFLDFIEAWLRVEEVKRVKIGDIEISNPSDEDMKALRSKLKGEV